MSASNGNNHAMALARGICCALGQFRSDRVMLINGYSHRLPTRARVVFGGGTSCRLWEWR
jgi:hypothetical protein